MNKPLSLKRKEKRSEQRKPAMKSIVQVEPVNFSLLKSKKEKKLTNDSLWFPIYRAREHDPL